MTALTDSLFPDSTHSLGAIGTAAWAACQEVDLITNDRIQSTAAGWGALPITTYLIANSIAESLKAAGVTALAPTPGVPTGGGGPERKTRSSIRITSSDTRKTPVEAILRDAIETAKKHGSDSADAALLAAVIMYFSGANVRVGVAAGAKSLGGMARMIAGADRAGVATLYSPWSTSRVSGIVAVEAIHAAMCRGELTRVNGAVLPPGIGGAPMVDDSVLGEDVIGPEVSTNGAKVGTEAMMKAFAGAGIPVNPIMCALFGTAAVLEVVHTDALVSDEYGIYGTVNTIHVAGASAARTAGLPETIHVRGTGEAVDVGRMVGELALILREVGSPTTIGMLAFQEILAMFEEGMSIGGGFSGGPVAASLGFMNAYAVLGIKLLLAQHWNDESAADLLQNVVGSSFIDAEFASLSYNTVARVADGIHPGLVSRLTLRVTEGAKAHAISRRIRIAINMMQAGSSVEDTARFFDEERLHRVERSCGERCSAALGKKVEIQITRLERNARRLAKLAKRFLSLDCDADVTVTLDGEPKAFIGVLHKVIPSLVLAQDKDGLSVASLAALPITELILSSHTIINATVPAVVGVLLGVARDDDAAAQAERGAWISCGTPGATDKCVRASQYARRYLAAGGARTERSVSSIVSRPPEAASSEVTTTIIPAPVDASTAEKARRRA